MTPSEWEAFVQRVDQLERRQLVVMNDLMDLQTQFKESVEYLKTVQDTVIALGEKSLND